MPRVSPPSLRGDVRAAAPWALLALAVWAAGLITARRNPQAETGAPSWQHSYLEFADQQRRQYVMLREGILDAENVRSETGAWPEPSVLAARGAAPFAPDALSPQVTWSLRRHGIYVNYVGVPEDTAAPRWLVLFIEPDPRTPEASPPPVDEEHHTLPNGMALHVTVWSQPNEGMLSEVVSAFPVTDGWVQRVGR